MAKLINKERFQGVGMELVKVEFIFSLVSEVLIFALAAYTKDLSYVPLLLALLLVPAYSVIMRRLIPSFILFFLAHAALYALVLLCNGILPMVVVGAYITVDVIYIYVRKISGVNDPMSVAQLMVAFALAFVLYLSTPQINMPSVRPILITFFIVQIVVYLIYFHQMNIKETLSANTQSASQSIAKINRLNNKVIIMFVVILLILIGAGVLLRFDMVFTMIGQGLLIALRFVVRLLFRGGDASPEGEPVMEERPTGGDTPNGVPEGYEPWKIWLILEKIMMVVCIVVAIVVIAYIAYRIYQKFKADRVEEDVLSDYAETTVTVERVARPKKERRTLSELFNLPNDKKVRRIFQKKIQHRINAGDPISLSQTPRQMCASVKAEDLTALTDLYEKARYSGKEITKEEVKSVS